jgi:TonB family protein
MKTSIRLRVACVLTLALLTLSSAVVVGAAPPPTPNGSAVAQSASTRRKRATARRRRARRSARTTTTVIAPVVRPGGVVGVQDVEGSSSGPAGPPAPSDDAPQTPAPKRTVVAGGVLNGKAISKPQPAYPPIAKAARASGTVVVQIVVGEDGRVISASAVSGHPLLQSAAVSAARQARFSPTLLSGQPVKVSGVITYNFVLQ